LGPTGDLGISQQRNDGVFLIENLVRTNNPLPRLLDFSLARQTVRLVLFSTFVLAGVLGLSCGCSSSYRIKRPSLSQAGAPTGLQAELLPPTLALTQPFLNPQ